MVMESLQRLDPPRKLGKLTLLAGLGEGGMASVYVASVGDGPLARLAAVKLLRPGAPDHDYRTRFLDEARVVVRLHHNNIVDVREAGEVGEQLYIAMELIEGRDLADVWDRCAERGRAFPVPLAVYIVREILRGLHYAHTFPGLSLVHRDISPSNILLDWAGAVRLADFGLATSAMKAAQTVAGVVFGKVGYMAPEQATRRELDGRADVYGCGVVLWELLTGRPLREQDVDTRTVARFDAPPPSTYSRRVDPQLDAIVVKALANDRDDRFESALAYMKALSEWIAVHAPDTTQETVSEFLLKLFGDTREKDHLEYTQLLESMSRTGVWDRNGEPVLERATRVVSKPHPGTVDGERVVSGTILGERYRVEKMLGRGGMGIVYLAEHLTVGRKVALKVLTHEWSRHEVVAARFREEARAASAAGHPNIVDVFDAGKLPDGRLYIAMEYLTGTSLYHEVAQKGRLDVQVACRYIRDIARAIKAAHDVGIIHRDLKPDNVMLVPRGDEKIIKVLDFGISASAVRSAEEQRLTQPGHALGTPEYMAPEQAKGHTPDPRFDIYAIGVMLYEALGGVPPFQSENMVEVLARKATEDAPRLETLREGLPPELCTLIHDCIEREPDARPPTAEDFLARLEPIMAGRSLQLASRSAQDLPGPPDFDRALDRVAGLSEDLLSVPGGTAEAPMARTEPLSDAVRRARRRRAAAGLGAGLAAAFLGLLWWGVPAIGEEPEEESEPVSESVVPADMGAAVPGTAVREPQPSEAALPGDAAVDAEADPKPTLERAEGEAQAGESESGNDANSEPGASEDDGSERRRSKKRSSRTGRSRRPSPDSAECREIRGEADRARLMGDWNSVLDRVSQRHCWVGRHFRERTRMQVQALFETGDFDACIRAGRRSTDKEVRRMVEDCRLRT